MNAAVQVLPAAGVQEIEDDARARSDAPDAARWSPAGFAHEQIRSLVAQLFVPGWPRPARQVVFCGVEETALAARVCWLTAQELALQVPGRVGLAEADPDAPALEELLGVTSGDREWPLVENLWLARRGNLASTTVELRARLGELRREFEYTVIHGPPVGGNTQGGLLGGIADGVVLVLQAHVTRRAAALQAKEALRSVNARLLGVVLDQRTFPIPERIYRRL
jgi:hypothetical protein